jgi:hypothetical protein
MHAEVSVEFPPPDIAKPNTNPMGDTVDNVSAIHDDHTAPLISWAMEMYSCVH